MSIAPHRFFFGLSFGQKLRSGGWRPCDWAKSINCGRTIDVVSVALKERFCQIGWHRIGKAWLTSSN
jgi:hypothetical protein